MIDEEISDFGGLVTTLTPALLDTGEAARAEFCELNDGILEASLGRTELFEGVTVSGAVTTIIDWHKLDGSNIVIVCTTADIYVVNFAPKTFTSIKPAAYTITGTRAWSWNYATIADKLVLTNGDDAPLEWNGVDATMALLTLPTDVTKPKFLLWWKNRLHLFNLLDGGNNKPFRHWWSELGVYNAWSALNGAGFLDYSGGGEPINGAAALENIVLLLKQSRATVISHTGISTSPFASRDLESVRGTYAPFSIQVTSAGVIYLAVDGLRLWDGVQSKLVSGHVDAFSNIPITTLAKATSVLDNVFKRYLLALPSVIGGNNDTLWNVLYQFYPAERMEFSKRQYVAGSEVRTLGKFVRSEDFTWQTFNVNLKWKNVTVAWNDPSVVGEFEEIMAGGYAGQVWSFENDSTDLGAAVPMLWESGTLPRNSGRAWHRLLSVLVGGVTSVNTTLRVEIVDADTGDVKFSKLLDFSLRRTHLVYPNRGFLNGFSIRLRNVDVGSIPAIDRLKCQILETAKTR